MPLAGYVEHGPLVYLVAVPWFASGDAAGNVDANEALAPAWVAKHLRQRVAFNVIIHHPMYLGEL